MPQQTAGFNEIVLPGGGYQDSVNALTQSLQARRHLNIQQQQVNQQGDVNQAQIGEYNALAQQHQATAAEQQRKTQMDQELVQVVQQARQEGRNPIRAMNDYRQTKDPAGWEKALDGQLQFTVRAVKDGTMRPEAAAQRLNDDFGVNFEFQDAMQKGDGYHYLIGDDGKIRVFQGANVVNVIDAPAPEKPEKQDLTQGHQTQNVMGPDGKSHKKQYNVKTGTYDIDLGLAPPKEFAPDRSADSGEMKPKEVQKLKASFGTAYSKRLADIEDQLSKEMIDLSRATTLKQQAQDDYEEKINSLPGQTATPVTYPKTAPAKTGKTAPAPANQKAQALEELKKRGYSIK